MQGRDIRRYRREIGWNQGAFAKELGLSQSALSLLESGKIAVSDEHMGRLTKAFDTAKIEVGGAPGETGSVRIQPRTSHLPERSSLTS